MADTGGAENPHHDGLCLRAHNLQMPQFLGESREPSTAVAAGLGQEAMPPRPPAALESRGSGIQRLGHAASSQQRDAALGTRPALQRLTRLGPTDMDLDELANDDDRTVSQSGRFLATGSHDWNSGISTQDSSAIEVTRWFHILLSVLPKVSDKVRKAGFIVQLQAFFKLSFEQFESNDSSFEELAEDARLAAAAEQHEQQHGQEQQQQQQRPGQQQGQQQQAAAARPPLPEAAAIATATATAASAANAAGALARSAKEAVGAVAAAFGTSGERGLVVDIDMKPSLANCARLVLLSSVHPNSMFKVLWDFLYLPINMWICLVTPVVVVFVANLRLTNVFGCVEFTIDVMCLADVFVHLRTAIITSDFKLRTSRNRIAAHYLWRHWGLLDLAACVPFLTLINIGPADDYSTRALLFRLLRLTKLLRIPNVLQTSNVRTYLSAKVLKQKGLVSLITLLAAVLVVIHHTACYFYFIGVVATSNAMRNIPELVDIETGILIHQSWVEAEELESYYKFGRYVMALYWAMYTFLTVGYGDIAIINTAEKIWAIITAVTGVVMAGWFMGAVGAYMGGTGGAEAEMQQRRQDVFQFIQKRRLRGDLAARVQKYEGAIMWRQLSDKDRQIIDGLPRMLRTEVVLHIYDKVVRKVSFMQTRPPQFVVELLLRLRLRLYDKGDYIVREGEMGGEIYFLAAGEAEVRRELPPNEDEDPDPTVDRRRSQAGDRLRHLSRIVITAGRSISNALARASLNPPAPPAATAGADPAADPAAGAGAGAAEGASCASSQHFSGLGRLSRGAGMGAAAAGAVASGGTAGPRGASSFQSGAVGASGASCPADVLTRLVRSVPPQGRRPEAVAATEQGHGYAILGHIQAGGLFGHVSCLAGEVRRNSIVAASAEGCEVLVLSKEDAEQLAKDWPDIYDDPAMHLDRGRRRSACLNDTLPAFVEHYVPLANGPLPARRRGAAAAASLGRNSHRHGGGRATAQLGRLSLGRVPEQRMMSMHQLGQLAAAGGAPFARASDMRTLSLWEDEAGGGGGAHGSSGGGAVTKRTAPPGQPNSEGMKERRPTGQSAQPRPQPQQQPQVQVQALLEEKPAVEGPCVPSGGGGVAAGIDGGAANRNIGGKGLGRGGGFVAAEGSSAVNHGTVGPVRGDGACGGGCAGGGRAGAAVAVLEMELQPREGE